MRTQYLNYLKQQSQLLKKHDLSFSDIHPEDYSYIAQSLFTGNDYREMYAELVFHAVSYAQNNQSAEDIAYVIDHFISDLESLNEVDEAVLISLFDIHNRMQEKSYICFANNNWLKNAPKNILEGHPFCGKGVVYTVITGDYDNVKNPKTIISDFDYVLVTDNPKLASDFWAVRYIENPEALSEIKLARKCKILCHELFPEYDYSIYIDGKVTICGDLQEFIHRYSLGRSMLCFPHFSRSNVSEELKELISLQRDCPETMTNQITRYFSEGFPTDYPLTDTCILIRNHRDIALQNSMNTWWEEVRDNSFRDQLSFGYSCWKNNFEFDMCNLYCGNNPYAIAGNHAEISTSVTDKDQGLFVLVGNDNPWFIESLITYFNQRNIEYMLYKEGDALEADNWYINCSEAPLDESFSSLKTIDLFFFMQISYFAFPEYFKVQKKASDGMTAKTRGIITGMSYFRDGIDTDSLGSVAVNLSASSQDLYFDYLELKAHYTDSIHWAVMGLAPYSLRYDESLSQAKKHLVSAYVLVHGNEGLHNNSSFSAIVSIREQIDDLFGHDLCDYLFWNAYVPTFGFTTYEMNAVFNEASVLLEEQFEVEQQYNKPYAATLRENKRIVADYLSFCEAHNINVIIVIPPFTEWYKARWNPSYIAELLEYLEALKEIYPFVLCDFSSQNWPDNCFRNASHLNNPGREQMTKAISSIISGIDSQYP